MLIMGENKESGAYWGREGQRGRRERQGEKEKERRERTNISLNIITLH